MTLALLIFGHSGAEHQVYADVSRGGTPVSRKQGMDLVQTLLSGNSRLSTRTTSVLTIHLITRLCNHITWIVLPLLCRGLPTVPLFPHPPILTLQSASWTVWQTSLLGQLRLTSSSTLVKLGPFWWTALRTYLKENGDGSEWRKTNDFLIPYIVPRNTHMIIVNLKDNFST